MVVDEMFPCIKPRKFRVDADFATTGHVYPMSREKEAGSAMGLKDAPGNEGVQSGSHTRGNT
jgi:hypothetical protein